MTRCKVVIPPLLLVMIFIHALHSCYSDILDQFRSCYKDLEAGTVDSVVADVKYHDEFQLVNTKSKAPRKGGPGASAVAVNKSGREWSTTFEWISSFLIKAIKTRWEGALAGTGICPICHRAKSPGTYPPTALCLKIST